LKAREARQLAWICSQCAFDSGAKPIKDKISTWHYDICGACKEYVTVTEPRDFDWRGVPNK